ncbi:MAG TPA: ABC transporter permease [Anaerolineaceae bacterium]|nr:ABC transporter permease [Anaerolineaceae bacterium]
MVLKNEFLYTVRRKSFLLTLILLPLVGFAVVLIAGSLQKTNAAQGTTDPITNIIVPSGEQKVVGYIDPAGIVIPSPIKMSTIFQRYDSEAQAMAAMENKDIVAFYIIDPDYLKTGKITYVNPEFNPLGGFENSGTIATLMNYSLMPKDASLSGLVQSPMRKVEDTYLSPEPQRESGNMLTFFMPYIVLLLFYMIILTASSLLLNSITNEKQNRVIEILMTSVTPTQLLTGKIIALGAVGLLQTVVWVGGGYLLLQLSGNLFSLPIAFILPPSFLFWAVIFFILGYAVYASLMAGVGALVPNLREASQATTVIVLPMVAPLMFISAIAEDPNGPISMFFSLFPLTSPVAMMARLTATTVPLLEILLSIVLLVLTSIFLVRGIALLFRAQILLSGQPFRFKTFFKALVGRG